MRFSVNIGEFLKLGKKNWKAFYRGCFDAGAFLGQELLFSLQFYLRVLNMEFPDENLFVKLICYIF